VRARKMGRAARKRARGRAVGMRRERAWTRLRNDWDASTSCASYAQSQSWNERELGMSFGVQLESSQFFEQFDNSFLLGYKPARLMFACRGRQQPTLWSISSAKVNFHACNEAMVRSGATSGIVWPCGFVRIGG
jgi:hypothetical protein